MLAYLNGEYLPADQARISPFDRGFLFADGVYEAIRTGPPLAGHAGPRFIAMNRHTRRLDRSLSELKINWDARHLAAISAELVKRSGLDSALIYFQVTRGTPNFPAQPARSHLPPQASRPPSSPSPGPSPPATSPTQHPQ